MRCGMWLAVGALVACADGDPKCGAGTHEEDGECVPDEASDTDTDVDSDTDVDTDTDVDSDTDTDTGDTGGEPCVDGTASLPADGTDADVLLTGSSTIRAGAEVAVVDLDADGNDDLVVSGPNADRGRVWVSYGPLSGSGAVDTVADATIAGDPDTNDDQFGLALAAIGDLDADGFGDFAVGSLWSDAFWIGFGGSTRLSGQLRPRQLGAFAVDADLSELGSAVAGVGDHDGDGFEDLAVAASGVSPPITTGTEGVVYLISGGATLSGEIDMTGLPTVVGDLDDDLCGHRCLVGDDFDGDGVTDLLIGESPADDSVLYIQYGGTALPPVQFAPDLPTIRAQDTGWREGLAAVGDLDGDGLPEFLVADDHYDGLASGGGKAWVFRGSTSRFSGVTPADDAWATFVGTTTDDTVGSAALGMGDVDCDGVGDLAVSGDISSAGGVSDAGAVMLYFGVSGGEHRVSDADHVLGGDISNSGFGTSLAFGDLDGDGAGDLVVGASAYSSNDGAVYVFPGITPTY